MKAFLVIFGIMLTIVAGAALFVWSGIYNAAATDPHWGITYKILEETRDRSVIAHSKNIVAPSLNDPKQEQNGAGHYQGACRLCHSAPGHSRSDFAKGLYPYPPRLTSKDAQEWKDEELFWIMKNGLKMTGMPAFGVTLEDEQLWATVAFLRRLPKLKAEEYNALVSSGSSDQEDQEDSGN